MVAKICDNCLSVLFYLPYVYIQHNRYVNIQDNMKIVAFVTAASIHQVANLSISNSSISKHIS